MLANRIRGSVYRKKKQEEQLPSYYKIAQDSDFSGTTDGRFKYIGTDEYIVIPNIIKGVAVTSYSEMFYRYAGTQLKGVASFNKNITNMYFMFRDSETTTLDLSLFDTSNVTNMRYVFASSEATTLDLSSFNTSNVITMDSMFNGSRATSLDLSSFNTSNVTSMNNMFASSRARTLDLSSFDTSNVTNVTAMFVSARTTTGYARTQADAYKFNYSSYKPRGLTFIVKP